MNDKLIDTWSLFHFLLPFFKTILLLHYTNFHLLGIILLVIIYEILEYLFLGDLLFKWHITGERETIKNAVMDIIIGIIAVLIAYIIYSNL